MDRISVYARLTCTVSYTDGSNESFASTVYEQDLKKFSDSHGNVNALRQIIASGCFNTAIQKINRHLNFCCSGVVNKNIRDCSISISGNITEKIKKKQISNIFGVYGTKDRIFSIGGNFDAKPAFADLISQWIEGLLRGR